eukprot:12895392-Prorocentrum_lima.AAC.1
MCDYRSATKSKTYGSVPRYVGCLVPQFYWAQLAQVSCGAWYLILGRSSGKYFYLFFFRSDEYW